MATTREVARDLFITGLRNAHAMEKQALELMARQSERMDDYPDLKARASEHVGETREQMKRLETCLDTMGESTSTLKDAALGFMANMQAMGHAMAGDEVLKNTFANNAFENFEIAAYRSLLALSEPAGATQAVPLLRQSLAEEEKMAKWIDSHIEPITLAYLEYEEEEKVG